MEIYERVREIDNREVKTLRERKSIGRETTLSLDTDNKEQLKVYLKEFAHTIASTMKNKMISGKIGMVKTKTTSFINGIYYL